ncbi:glycosyltransferase [Gillisia sp. Q332]|uniref:glycosyltransferase n=1 Tax=Gillisia xinjiangensis TaxID=3384765 RepID=UPI00391CB6C3
MRVLQLIQKSQTRGAEMFTCQLSNILIEKGHEVKILSLFEGEAHLPFNGKIYSLNANLKNRFFDISAWRNLHKIIREFKPDIIQANAGDTLKYIVFSKIIFGWKIPVIARNASEVGSYLKSSFQKRINNFFYKNVEYVISVSKASEKDILNHFPFLSGKTKVVPVGLEINSEIKKIVLEPEDCQHIVHVGGFTFEKNHEGILRIFQSLAGSNQKMHLHLVGDGPLKSKIEKEVNNLGLNSKITFYGFVSNPLSYIKEANVFILPSIIEGLPAVILEAMFCQIPVIAYNVGGIGEIVVNGKTGWLIEKNDETGFKNTLEMVLGGHEANSSRIEIAKKMVVDNYSNEIIADQFLSCYSDVIGLPKTSTHIKMKILHIVTKRQYRGAELFAAYLSSELIKLGHEVVFVGLYENEKDVLVVENAENRDLVSAKNGKFSFYIVKKIVKLVNEIKPDIIQCNGSDTLKYTVAASLFFRNIPLVYRNISIISEWISSRPKKIIYKRMFQRIAHVTSVGDQAMADFIKTYNYPINRTEVIRRGIPIKGLDREKLYKELRIDMGFDQKSKIALHIGNFSPEKNHEFLLDIFEELEKEASDIKLVCVGNGILLEKMKQIVEEKRLYERVFFLGFRKDIPELLAASDCLVLCSKVEGVPGVILEAGTQKIPSISTNVGGVSEVLINGQTGFLIDDFNKKEFKEKLIELMNNSELRKLLGENAFSMISKGFDPEINAKKFEQLYQKLITPTK